MESKAGLLIVDSMGMACGGDLKEQEQATNFFQALRELQVTALLLTHTAKDELRKTKTAFGSVYFQNHSRSLWEMTKSQDTETDSIKVALFQRKQNEAMLHKPLVLELQFNNILDTTTFKAADISQSPDLRDRMSLKDQLRLCLKHGPRSQADLAIELDKTEEVVRVTLNKYKEMFVKIGSGWALLTRANP
jgi:hypothetical protein